MDPILIGFLLVTVATMGVAVVAWWSGRPWTAAAIAVVALLAATPLTRLLSDPVIVAALVVLTGLAGWAAWPHTRTGATPRARRGGARPGRGGAP
ncbi:hypothetical protein EV383_4255 [Pseudonocardia sediminis]|uniref:Uncharacterized protein n=1 Tax=Pseudonocardia sediminis TaxID=1397368 RepID=A0A4Q7UZC5_PSEST|nr:hypothetical protein [Pseudonocardia sediminis]RZT87336.1 hypothetical protein EV383_4255 [Pseudonocardia sediminis]